MIIDAPGHKEFIKNMITGASQAEAAVLICSVAEGVQEQTKRHAYVIKLLGLEQVLVAYNKMDLVGYDRERFLEVKQDMDRFLRRIEIRPGVEVPISAHVGDNVANRSENMPWYNGPTVLEALDLFEKIPPPTRKPLRFPVQDVYRMNGETIVAGRVESGVLEGGRSCTSCLGTSRAPSGRSASSGVRTSTGPRPASASESSARAASCAVGRSGAPGTTGRT